MNVPHTDPLPHDDLPGQRTLVDLVWRTFDTHPAAPAIVCDGQELTYAELANVVSEQVARLHVRGLGRGTRLGVRVPCGTMHLPVAGLAAICAGASCVPVDWEVTGAEARAIWEGAGVAAVYGKDLVITDRRRTSEMPDTDDPLPTDEAGLILPPGSTNLAEARSVTHREAVALLEEAAERYRTDAPLGPGEPVTAEQPHSLLTSYLEMWLAWRHGAVFVPGHAPFSPVG